MLLTIPWAGAMGSMVASLLHKAHGNCGHWEIIHDFSSLVKEELPRVF